MHLKRIRVPDFRVLKDVDISFEEKFSPRIFPLGSQNGGGKSTLLQLIFVLLHCSFTPDGLAALKNLLRYFSFNNVNKKTLATIDLAHEGKEIELEFICCKDSYIDQLVLEADFATDTKDKFRFSMISELEVLKQRIAGLTNEGKELKGLVSKLEDINSNNKIGEHQKRVLIEDIALRLADFTSEYRNISSGSRMLQEEALEQLRASRKRYTELEREYVILSAMTSKMMEYLTSKNLIYVCNYSAYGSDENLTLLCRVSNIDDGEVKSFLNDLSHKVFLAAPSTQVFLFLGREINKLLFKQQDKKVDRTSYHVRFREVKSGILNLFTYDFLDVDILIDAFKLARDKDFMAALETGEYGNAYKFLLNDLNSLLTDKQINLSSNLSEVTFRSLRSNENNEFYPEDLSHGELKRLSIYMWLKYRNIEDAIVLMDEIEIALHPDWQYGIVSDLMQWSPTNQYILATHSYELCQALTPAHVKELEPKLLRQTEQSV